jgi:hypothetical protein
MAKAIDFLATLLREDTNAEWKIGPLGHALHALALYDARVFVAKEAKEADEDVPEELSPSPVVEKADAPADAAQAGPESPATRAEAAKNQDEAPESETAVQAGESAERQ